MATAVVDPVKMPKVKADNNIIATVNAVSTTLAIFMGWMTIFAAIASFTTKGWNVGIPFSGLLLWRKHRLSWHHCIRLLVSLTVLLCSHRSYYRWQDHRY